MECRMKKKKRSQSLPTNLFSLLDARSPVRLVSHTREAQFGIPLNHFPDDILQHVFSFLEVKDIARLQVVSKRFQTLCMSVPSFSFSHLEHSPNCSCLHVFNFMKSLPRLRPHDLKIDTISFSSSCLENKHSEIHMKWLWRLFQAFHVDELSLDCVIPSILEIFPKFQSLKVLKLQMSVGVTVKLFELQLASLETLHLMWFETEDTIGEWVSQSFPSLKSLNLFHVNLAGALSKQSDLVLRSSCLEDLTIDHCCGFKIVRIFTHNLRALSYVNCTGIICDYCELGLFEDNEILVEVAAPNLQNFTWGGPPTRLCYDKMTFMNLHVATIKDTMSTNLNRFKQLFEAIRKVEMLSLDTIVLRRSYGTPLISFGDLRHLEIKVAWGFTDGGDVLITNFLERISNLETVAFTNYLDDEEPDQFDFKYALSLWKRAEWKKIKGLKKVKFTMRNVYHSMAFLIAMLKKSCVDMEEMTLIYPSCYHKSMKHYLSCFESASSGLSINLIPLNQKRKGC